VRITSGAPNLTLRNEIDPRQHENRTLNDEKGGHNAVCCCAACCIRSCAAPPSAGSRAVLPNERVNGVERREARSLIRADEVIE